MQEDGSFPCSWRAGLLKSEGRGENRCDAHSCPCPAFSPIHGAQHECPFGCGLLSRCRQLSANGRDQRVMMEEEDEEEGAGKV